MGQRGSASTQLSGHREDHTETGCPGRLEAAIDLCPADTPSLWLTSMDNWGVYPETRRVEVAGLMVQAAQFCSHLRCLEEEDPPVCCLQLEHVGLLTVVRSPGGQSMMHTDGILQVALRQSLVGPVFILSEACCVTPGCGLLPHTSHCPPLTVPCMTSTFPDPNESHSMYSPLTFQSVPEA